jgi:hypothetical protein
LLGGPRGTLTEIERGETRAIKLGSNFQFTFSGAAAAVRYWDLGSNIQIAFAAPPPAAGGENRKWISCAWPPSAAYTLSDGSNLRGEVRDVNASGEGARHPIEKG